MVAAAVLCAVVLRNPCTARLALPVAQREPAGRTSIRDHAAAPVPLAQGRRGRRSAGARIASPPTDRVLRHSKDPGRLSHRLATAQGMLSLPVNGARIRGFGAPDGVGGNRKGAIDRGPSRRQITAPCDGWVLYAGVFRNYDQLLIPNAGGGFHVLLAGMEWISVDLGQFVVTGEPVAVMGGGAQSAAAVAGANPYYVWNSARTMSPSSRPMVGRK